jgi:hypothetical protein
MQYPSCKASLMCIMTMEKEQIHISDASYVTPLSKDYSEQYPSCLKWFMFNDVLSSVSPPMQSGGLWNCRYSKSMVYIMFIKSETAC